MKTLMPIVVFSVIMALFSDKNSIYELNEYGCKKYIYKDKLIYFIMAMCMAIFVGLRTRGNDTYVYRQMYEGISGDLSSIASINWAKLSDTPAMQMVEIFLKSINASTQDYFMLFSLFTIAVYLWFIRKYTSNIRLSIYYFITMGVYTFTMAAIKQTTAVAFLLIATDRAIEKKWIKFIVWVTIAELFHSYAFIYLVIPFLFFSPWSKKTYWLLAGTVFVAIFLQRFMGSILAMTDVLGYEGTYSNSEFSGEGVNIFRVLVVFVPVFLSFLSRRHLKNSDDRANNLILNLTMMNAMIMFIGLFGTANYFARLANYFLIFQCLSLPWIFQFFNWNSRRLLAIMSCAAFWIYFYYQMVWAQGAFDDVYGFMNFFDFIKQLFRI